MIVGTGFCILKQPCVVNSGHLSTVAARACQLADVAAALYEASPGQQQTRHIRVPLEPSFPLVAVLVKALEREEKADSTLKAGQQLAVALLEGAVSAHNADGSDSTAFPFLLVRAQIC